jgi:hypothetical protein
VSMVASLGAFVDYKNRLDIEMGASTLSRRVKGAILRHSWGLYTSNQGP